MALELVFSMFLRAQLAASLAVLVVLALRQPTRRVLGAELTYGFWLLPGAAAVVSLFPTLPEYLDSPCHQAGVLRPGRFVDWSFVTGHAHLLASIWLTGALALGAVFALGQWRFERSAKAGRAGPAACGFWPRMITPSDYAERFTVEQRTLIRAHERAHMLRQDPTTNLMIALFQAACWFNPLTYVAARCARMDQELAIDAKVVALYPRDRRRYGEVLLKAHARGLESPLACALALGGRHPMEVRLAMLGVRRISVKRDRLGAFAIGALGVALALLLWTLAPF